MHARMAEDHHVIDVEGDDGCHVAGSKALENTVGHRSTASLLKANLFNLHLYSDIVASADSSIIEHLSPLGPWLVL